MRTKTLEINNQTNQIEGWYCTLCDCYNDALTAQCWNCIADQIHINNTAIQSPIRAVNRSIILAQRMGLSEGYDNMSEDKIELHTKFFNEEKLLVSQMDMTQLRIHMEELSKIAFEARARLNAIDDEVRERKNKLSPEGKSWLVSSDNENISNKLNNVKERQKRMTKADKLLETMNKLGVENADELIKNVEKANSGGSITTHHSRVIEDKRPTNIVDTRPPNTQESLLGDSATMLVEGLKNDYPVDSVVKIAITTAHLANKLLGKVELEVIEEIRIEESKETSTFDVSDLFK